MVFQVDVEMQKIIGKDLIKDLGLILQVKSKNSLNQICDFLIKNMKKLCKENKALTEFYLLF